ncbi:hypothetical protein SLS56_008660 [Neofusicoccum ribis]|uniref:Clr5 domain-containing protein n=1 Tax=Neofusicoccum ribis TaxID=45134 RepID=A0ABR3SJF9_9PEZI
MDPPEQRCEHDWEAVKPEIERLYMQANMSLRELMESLKTSRGLSATKAQYEAQFKKWNFRKNVLKGQAERQWKTVKWKVEKRKRDGKDSNVYVDGVLPPNKKVKKEMARYNLTTIERLDFGKLSPVIPYGVMFAEIDLKDRLSRLEMPLPSLAENEFQLSNTAVGDRIPHLEWSRKL